MLGKGQFLEPAAETFHLENGGQGVIEGEMATQSRGEEYAGLHKGLFARHLTRD